jgi:site-specific DNA-methyltransferase (adenine-specific)
MIELFNIDCMEYMKGCEDNAFDLAIVDPPYGVKRDKGFGGFVGFGGFGEPIARREYKGEWDSVRPDKKYFNEMLRVSKLAIVWGGNFFADMLPAGTHWIFWNKMQTMPTFGDGELAWTNHKRKSIKMHTLEYNGLLGKEITRIHPTQKPVKLYKWLLTNYAEPGQRILDTHLGSGSSAIAAHYFGVDFVGCELDPDYYQAAMERFERETAQVDMFAP